MVMVIILMIAAISNEEIEKLIERGHLNYFVAKESKHRGVDR